MKLELAVLTGSSVPLALDELARRAPRRSGAALERYEITLDLDRRTLSLALLTLEKRTARVAIPGGTSEGASAIPPDIAPRPAPAPPARPRGLRAVAYALGWVRGKL